MELESELISWTALHARLSHSAGLLSPSPSFTLASASGVARVHIVPARMNVAFGSAVHGVLVTAQL